MPATPWRLHRYREKVKQDFSSEETYEESRGDYERRTCSGRGNQKPRNICQRTLRAGSGINGGPENSRGSQERRTVEKVVGKLFL
jgi:hypothetical protein